jgi:hypothetical protein
VEEENMQLNLAIVAANNHYAGFGPGTVNIFNKMVGLSEKSLKYKCHHNRNGNKNNRRLKVIAILLPL